VFEANYAAFRVFHQTTFFVKSVYELALFASNGRALVKEKIKAENEVTPSYREHAEKKKQK